MKLGALLAGWSRGRLSLTLLATHCILYRKAHFCCRRSQRSTGVDVAIVAVAVAVAEALAVAVAML